MTECGGGTHTAYENEQMRLEYIQELKRRFEDEKRTLESELVRMHDGLRTERSRRLESESLHQEVCRVGFRPLVPPSRGLPCSPVPPSLGRACRLSFVGAFQLREAKDMVGVDKC